jgi:hypothetical protein
MKNMTTAQTPEDITRLFVERVNAGDVALTATEAQDDAGARAQIVRRQPDGSWLRVLDRPDFTK